MRIRNQLRALGARYTLVHAFDKRSASMQALSENVLSTQRKAGVLALYKTQLAVFDYIVASPFERFLILEDDVLLHRNFPVAFDAGIRRIPTDWRVLFLGANTRTNTRNSTWAAGGWWPETFASIGFYRPRNVWSSWAIAVHRDAAKVRRDVLRAIAAIRGRTYIRTYAYTSISYILIYSCARASIRIHTNAYAYIHLRAECELRIRA